MENDVVSNAAAFLTKKKKDMGILDELSLETDIPAKEIKKESSGVESAIRGAAVAMEAGQNPQELSGIELKQKDPLNTLQAYKEKSDAEAKEENAKADKQKLIATAFLNTLPTLLGGVFGGAAGASIGAQSGLKGTEVLESSYEKSRKERADTRKDAFGKVYETLKQKQELQAKADENKEQRDYDMGKEDRKYAFENKKLGADALLKQIEANQKLAKDKIDGENKLRDDYFGNGLTKEFNLSASGLGGLRELVGIKTPTGADDVAMIYAFMKAQDPGSVVKEGEFQTAQNYAQNFQERFGIKIGQLKGETPFLTPQARKALLAAAETKFGGFRKEHDKFQKTIGDIAQKRGYDLASVIGGGQEQVAETAPPPGSTRDKVAATPKLPPKLDLMAEKLRRQEARSNAR